jgi:hypothetical protein
LKDQEKINKQILIAESELAALDAKREKKQGHTTGPAIKHTV